MADAHTPTGSLGKEYGLTQLLTFMSGHAIVRSLSVLTELAIPDLLSTGPRTAATLASRARVDEQYLYRILRALAAVGIFEQDTRTGAFGLNNISALLCTDHPRSLRDFVRLRGHDVYWRAWEALPEALHTGSVPFVRAHGVTHYDYLQHQPAFAQLFNRGVRALTSQASEAIALAYDFASIRSLLDVGGGDGILLASILQAHAHLQGTLFELPQVCAQARASLVAANLGGRYDIVAGDFFTHSLPRGADCLMLSRVLHNWSDVDCVRILRACRSASMPGCKLLVIEYVISDDEAGLPAKLFDLQMLVYFGRARERSVQDYEGLFAHAGYELQRLLPTSVGLSIIEATARE